MLLYGLRSFGFSVPPNVNLANISLKAAKKSKKRKRDNQKKKKKAAQENTDY